MASCAPSEERASSRPIEVHEPCGFALTVIEHGNPEPKFTRLDSSGNCMQNFVQMIHKLAKDIHEQKRKHPFFRGDRSSLHKDASKSVGFGRTNSQILKKKIWTTAITAAASWVGLTHSVTGRAGIPILFP